MGWTARLLLVSIALVSARGAWALETPTPAAWQKDAAPDAVVVYPNPCAKTHATVAFVSPSDARARVLLYSETGAVMTDVEVGASAGPNAVPLDLSLASPGVYYVRVHLRLTPENVAVLPADKPAKFLVVR